MTELLVCVFSIIHRSTYVTSTRLKKDYNIEGSLELLVDEEGLYICASDDKGEINNTFGIVEKTMRCILKITNIKLLGYRCFIFNPVETYRKKGFLYLKDDEGGILKVTIKE